MLRSDLVQAISADNPNLPLPAIDAVVSCFFEQVANQLVNGGRVELRRFGTFTTRAREERVGRNPSTGEPVQVNAKRALHFKPAKGLRESVANAGG